MFGNGESSSNTLVFSKYYTMYCLMIQLPGVEETARIIHPIPPNFDTQEKQQPKRFVFCTSWNIPLNQPFSDHRLSPKPDFECLRTTECVYLLDLLLELLYLFGCFCPWKNYVIKWRNSNQRASPLIRKVLNLEHSKGLPEGRLDVCMFHSFH